MQEEHCTVTPNVRVVGNTCPGFRNPELLPPGTALG